MPETTTSPTDHRDRKDNPRLGFIYALASVILPSAVFYIVPVLNAELGVWGVSALWFPLGTLIYLLMGLFTGGKRRLRLEPELRFKVVLLALIQTTGTALFFFALANAEPALVSFVNNLTPVLAAVGSVILYKERFRWPQLLGGALVVGGALMLTYYDDGGSLTGILFMAAGSVFYAAHGLLARHLAKRVDPIALGFWRTGMMSLCFVVLALARGRFQIPTSGHSWLLLGLGALLGPVGSIYPFYLALERWTVGKVTLVRGSMPLWVLLWGLALQGTMPGGFQLFGGALTLIGAALIILYRRRNGTDELAVK